MHLLTEEHARIFVEEYRRETARLARESETVDDRSAERLKQVQRELDNLAQNMLSGVLSPMLMRMLEEREAEKARLEAQPVTSRQAPPSAEILPHPALKSRFEEKVATLRASLNTDATRPEASQILSRLIESVTIYPASPDGPEAEVVARTVDLVAFAANENGSSAGALGPFWCMWLRGQDLAAVELGLG